MSSQYRPFHSTNATSTSHFATRDLRIPYRTIRSLSVARHPSVHRRNPQDHFRTSVDPTATRSLPPAAAHRRSQLTRATRPCPDILISSFPSRPREMAAFLPLPALFAVSPRRACYGRTSACAVAPSPPPVNERPCGWVRRSSLNSGRSLAATTGTQKIEWR